MRRSGLSGLRPSFSENDRSPCHAVHVGAVSSAVTQETQAISAHGIEGYQDDALHRSLERRDRRCTLRIWRVRPATARRHGKSRCQDHYGATSTTPSPRVNFRSAPAVPACLTRRPSCTAPLAHAAILPPKPHVSCGHPPNFQGKGPRAASPLAGQAVKTPALTYSLGWSQYHWPDLLNDCVRNGNRCGQIGMRTGIEIFRNVVARRLTETGYAAPDSRAAFRAVPR